MLQTVLWSLILLITPFIEILNHKMSGTIDMNAPTVHYSSMAGTSGATREGGHVMMMHFNIGLPLGEMLFKNWVVEDEKDLAWVSQSN